MSHTELVYLLEGQLVHDTAQIISLEPLEGGKTTIILNRTIFYPQGGGQPYDTGTISNKNGRFLVDEVRFIEGLVHHKGQFTQGSFEPSDEVELIVDAQQRFLHSRLHTAGHLVDLGLTMLGIDLIPSKGYHYPDSPYNEYEGILDEEIRNTIQSDLEEAINKLVKQDLGVTLKLVSKQELEKICRHVPTSLPEGKPIRVMIVENHAGIPCGGTHVTSTGQVGHMLIPAIKYKKGNTRINYKLAEHSL